MKKLATISLIIFGIVVTAVLSAGLVLYQNKKDNQLAGNQTSSKVLDTINQLTSSGKNVVLDMAEITKHNRQNDCWYLINSKVYNITSFFGSHPGGNDVMTSLCGKDATAAYMTKDSNATSNGKRSAHSSGAVAMLANYYLGDFNQIIGQQKIADTNTVVAPSGNGGEDENEQEDEYEDD
ncbi:MAG: cytochrome b5-like heme/steroid binding domain-containing protein [Candidatus Paceibacterota bacterium]|jgi:cytochrome b involved in lipid metabolism